MSVKVTILNNNRIQVEGDFTIQDAEGNLYDLAGRTAIGLCRCGQSNNKPFCDGSHGKMGFDSTCKAFALPAPKPKV
jgi:CDGSH-type Zn-finger protein